MNTRKRGRMAITERDEEWKGEMNWQEGNMEGTKGGGKQEVKDERGREAEINGGKEVEGAVVNGLRW